jgi:hypothetical protein
MLDYKNLAWSPGKVFFVSKKGFDWPFRGIFVGHFYD